MKNMIITVLTAYIFWTDFCEIHPLPVLPVLVITIWILVSETEEFIKDYQKSRIRGERLSRKIKRAMREVI